MRGNRRPTIGGCLITVGCWIMLLSSSGHAEQKLGFGLYVPETAADALERFTIAQSIAKHLSKHLGVTVEGLAYKTASDFEWDVRARKVHFAVLGAFYLASARKRNVRLLAQARSRSGGHARWTIMCKQKATLQQMKGKVLQVAHLGSIILPLLQNGLLDGLPPKTYFRITRSPTQPSAVLAVQLGKADATVAPMTTSGLKPLFDGISVPPPAFVALDPRLPAALVQKATTAMVSRKETLAGISGWGSVDASAYQSLVARSKRKVHRMELTSVQGIPLPHRDLLAIDPLHLELPELQASFVIP